MSGTDDIVSEARRFLERNGTPGAQWDPLREVLIAKEGIVTHFVHLGPLQQAFAEATDVGRRRMFERRLLALRKQQALSDEMLKERLLPRPRTMAQYELSELHRKVVERVEEEDSAELSIPHLELAPGLGVHLVFELSEESADVNAARLRGWKRELRPLYDWSVEHLRARTTEKMHELKRRLFASTISDGHDAARIVLNERLDALPVRGELIVMVPHTDLLLAASATADSALAEMARLGLQTSQQPQGISGAAYRRKDDGTFEAWLPPEDHPSRELFVTARIPAQSKAYGRQKELLEAWFELEGDATDVAPYAVLEQGKKIISAAVWLKGSSPLLPEAEHIAFAVPQTGNNLRIWPVPWAKAAALPGVKVVRDARWTPVRYSATGFPGADVLEAAVRSVDA